MNYNKQPLSYPQVIQMLKDRGLIFQDEDEAINQLKIIGYFRLAHYLRPMESDKVSHRFKPNSYFSNAIDIYYFDKKLRVLLFTVIQSFEIALRSKLIHHFSMEYGPFWVTDIELFVDKKIFAECVHRIEQEVSRSKEDFIQEYFDKYSTPKLPPAWKSLEVISFGSLSRIFCNLKDKKLKKLIAREFNLSHSKLLESWCRSAVTLRNHIAHHSRTWNKTYPIQPQLPSMLNGEWINTKGISNNKLYPQLCYLAYLENVIHPANDFKNQLKQLLIEHPNIDVTAMGFPSGWENEPLWRNE